MKVHPRQSASRGRARAAIRFSCPFRVSARVSSFSLLKEREKERQITASKPPRARPIGKTGARVTVGQRTRARESLSLGGPVRASGARRQTGTLSPFSSRSSRASCHLLSSAAPRPRGRDALLYCWSTGEDPDSRAASPFTFPPRCPTPGAGRSCSFSRYAPICRRSSRMSTGPQVESPDSLFLMSVNLQIRESLSYFDFVVNGSLDVCFIRISFSAFLIFCIVGSKNS